MPSTHARSSSPAGYLPTLDGWRAIAICLVLAVHTAPFTGHGAFLERFRVQGYLGVDLFFAISGLLICSRLLDEERTKGSINLGRFYLRRTCRIFPAAYLYLGAIAVLAMVHVIPMDWPAWGSAVAFFRNYFACFVRDTAAGRFSGHFWSLAIEEHFYLLLPSLLVLFPRRRKLVLSALIVGAFCWLVIYMKTTPPLDRQLYWERRTDLRINSLLFPALLAVLLQEERVRRFIARFTRPGIILSLLVVLVAGQYVRDRFFEPGKVRGAVVRQTSDVTANSSVVTDPADTAQPSKDITVHVVTLIVPYLFPFVILATMLHPLSVASRVLEWGPLRSVGRISYSLYVWQQLFWVRAPNWRWPIHYVQNPWIGMALTILCAVASYYWVEKPLISWGHRLTASKGIRTVSQDSSTQTLPQRERMAG